MIPLSPATADQIAAWRFYGASGGRDGVKGGRVGEVRYVAGWMSDQTARLDWRVSIGEGGETWRLTLPDGTELASDATEGDAGAATHPLNASRRLLDAIGWDERTTRQVTVNLFVAGELHYGFDAQESVWRVVSVIRPDRDRMLRRMSLVTRIIWAHPADPDAPDAPLFGVLGILDDLVWLNRQSRSQSASRAGTRGVVGVSDQMTTAAGASGEAFWSDFEASLARAMDDPSDVSPVGLIGPTELVEPAAGGKGMKGLSWVIPDFPYDDRLDQREAGMIRRLSQGLPIPPEVLLGMQAQSRATAFQVEESAYRAHVEPFALLVADGAEKVLTQLLPDVGPLKITPDSTALLARRHSVSDALEAFDRGAVGYDYLRQVMAIDPSAAMTEADLSWFQRIQAAKAAGRRETAITDPGVVAADEAVTAAADPGPDETAADELLAELLDAIDTAALLELVGASEQVVDRALSRMGARARSSSTLRRLIPEALTDAEAARQIGPDALSGVGIDVPAAIAAAITPALTWWTGRLAQAQQSAADLLAECGVALEFAPDAGTQSVEKLRAVLSEGIFTAVEPEALRMVVALAGREG